MAIVEGSTLTLAQTVELLEAHTLRVDAGLDLLDADDNFIMDLTDDLIVDGSSVSLGVYRTIHRTAQLKISRELQWGSQRLRPYLLLSSDDTTWYRWPLGVFLPSVPECQVGESPQVWDVACMDKLDVLNTPYGSSYSLAVSSNVIDAVEALITAAGETSFAFEPSTAVTPALRAYSIVDDWTTLTIINDLLESIGFRALWVDANGTYRSGPYVAPESLPSMWTYSTDSETTTVAEERVSIRDYYNAANVVVGIRDTPEDDIPITGDGIYTATNQSDGLTSIDARGGRTIRKVIRGDFIDHAALVVAVDAALDSEKRVANYVTMATSPNPLHGHFDAITLTDSAIPVNGRFLVTDWELPLDGSDMSLSLRAV